MSGWGFTRWSALLSIAMGVSVLSGNCAIAQISSDGTLPINSNVTQDSNTFNITGGTQAGSNLFHSFKEFSVPNSSTASFNNMGDIQNIISRVTGSSVSNIDGLIRANGTANLFLINPNGIIFGRNARLDIGGSFLASTGSSLKFPDNLEFSAINPQSAPLLSINVPIGLQYGVNPGSILVQGDGQGIRRTNKLIDTENALRVQPNQTLALVGGDISLKGATLKTAGGRIEFGSVAGEGLVRLTPTNKGFSLSYDSGIQNFRDIKLSQQAVVDASGNGGGDIQIQGRRISLTSGSQIEASTLGTETGGTLLVNGSELVELSGTGTSFREITATLGAQVYPKVSGAGGNLIIKTGQLILRDGARISAETFGTGKGGVAGTISITANSVRLDQGTIQANALSGNGGNINLNIADLLLMRHESEITTSAGTNQKPGNGGNIVINAPSGFIVAAAGENNDITANAFSGSGGKITINTAGIFGIAPLSWQELKRLRRIDLNPLKLSTNDITAISQTNPTLNGTIELNTPGINPNTGLVELPTIQVETKVAQVCDSPGYAQSSFIITGRGGLPSNPTKDILTPDAVEVGWVSLKPSSDRNSSSVTIKPTTTMPERIVEASGWVTNEKGEVVLTANLPTANIRTSWHNPVACHISHQQ
jgi:filamentous hemagglutinin family protein